MILWLTFLLTLFVVEIPLVLYDAEFGDDVVEWIYEAGKYCTYTKAL